MKRAIVGGRSDHKPGAVYAEEINGDLHFAALLRSGSLAGQTVRIVTPVMESEQILALVIRRLASFMARHGARESPEHAVIRKAVAAQGKLAIAQAKHLMNPMQRMELDMMLSKSSHAQALPYEQSQGKPVVRVSATGTVTGLTSTLLLDNAGGRYRRTT